MSRPRVARGDSSIDSLVDLMTRYHVVAIPIVDSDDRPIGIVTKLDLVECRDEERKTARELMMPHAMSLRPQDTLVRAAALMSREGFHHVLVVTEDGKLEGIVSTFDVTRWVANLEA
jgi:CBS domain-containing protein